MMRKKLTELSIVVNSPGPILAGQCLTGNVVVELSEPKDMRAISIKLKGIGYCQWKETEQSDDGTQTSSFTGEEVILKREQILFGKANATLKKHKHAAGRHLHPFSFTLPQMLPSSFSGEHGYIRYLLKAKITRPWKFDHKVSNIVIIYDTIDANNPAFADGGSGEKHKDYGCFCFKTGRLSLTASTDRSCYYPGESILINARVQNQTTKDMNSMRASLIQVITYSASNKKKLPVKKEVAEIKSPMIPREEEERWENKALTIPDVATTTRNSKVIDIHYILKVSVGQLKGRDTEIKIPIMIGTIPYIQAEQYFDPGPPVYPIPYPTCPEYPSAPPSYSDVIAESGISIDFRNDSASYEPSLHNTSNSFAQSDHETSCKDDGALLQAQCGPSNSKGYGNERIT